MPADGVCTRGSYCPEGSYQPTPCPSGTIASSLGNDEVSDCVPCPAGQYCTPESSQQGHSDPCDAG